MTLCVCWHSETIRSSPSGTRPDVARSKRSLTFPKGNRSANAIGSGVMSTALCRLGGHLTPAIFSLDRLTCRVRGRPRWDCWARQKHLEFVQAEANGFARGAVAKRANPPLPRSGDDHYARGWRTATRAV